MTKQIGNVHGVVAVGSQDTLLATVVSDGANSVVVDTGEFLEVGMQIDIATRATGVATAEDRTITDINDVTSAAVATTVAGVAAVNEVQTLIEGGAGLTSWTITYAGQTTAPIDDDATTAQVQAALEALSNIAPGDVVVAGTTAPINMTVTFQGTLAGTNVAQMTTTPTGGTGVVDVATQTAGVAPVNEQQTITVVAEGGEFTITYSGQTTDPIRWNASAEQVERALEALSNVGVGDITVTKASNVYTLEFTGALAGGNRAEVTTDATHLTQGAVTVTYSGADVAATNAMGIYPAGSVTSEVFDLSEMLGSSAKMDAALTNLDPVTYSEAELNKLTENDKMYALRLAYASETVN